jgi:hypothetical protein
MEKEVQRKICQGDLLGQAKGKALPARASRIIAYPNLGGMARVFGWASG